MRSCADLCRFFFSSPPLLFFPLTLLSSFVCCPARFNKQFVPGPSPWPKSLSDSSPAPFSSSQRTFRTKRRGEWFPSPWFLGSCTLQHILAGPAMAFHHKVGTTFTPSIECEQTCPLHIPPHLPGLSSLLFESYITHK